VYDDLGSHTVKNIDEPVRAYRVTNPASPDLKQKSGNETALNGGGKVTVAVMPFLNLSDDPSQQYFSDGITEDIITDLSRFHEIVVKARSSTFEWRNRNVDVRQLGRSLGIHYIIEGSVRRLGSRVRITVQLIDTISGDHVWSERFDREQQDIFAIQDEIIRIIVATLVGRLQAAEAERIRRKPPASLAAYEFVLRAQALPVVEVEAEAEAEACHLYERAIELDSNYAQAHVRLAYVLTLEWFWDMNRSNALLDRAFELAKKAVALDQNDRMCHDILGWV
jgi:TolB-like protein